MPFRTDYVHCPKVGRKHFLVCYLRCKGAKTCRALKEHIGEQSRFIEQSKQDKVLPAYQRFLPGWIQQPWVEEEKKEEKKEKKEEEANGDEEESA